MNATTTQALPTLAPQDAERAAKAEEIFGDDKLIDKMAGLYFRWQDEREYEDIADYAKAMEADFSAHGATVLRATKKPFGMVCELRGAEYHYTVSASSASFKRIK